MVIEHQREHCFWVAQRFQRAAIQALTLKTNCRHNGKWERLTHDCSPAIDEKYFEPFHNAQTIALNGNWAAGIQFAPSYACRSFRIKAESTKKPKPRARGMMPKAAAIQASGSTRAIRAKVAI